MKAYFFRSILPLIYSSVLTVAICLRVFAQDPALAPPEPPQWTVLEDADQDGLTDWDEFLLSLDPLNPLDGLSDADGDELWLAWEWYLGTHSDLADTDGDGWSDSLEVLLYGTDPLDPVSKPLGNGDEDHGDAAAALEPEQTPTPEEDLPPPPPPSLSNGDFTDIGIQTWKDQSTSKSYQGGGFQWGEGTASSWSAYVGNTIEVWQANGETFVELDGNTSSYGIKQPIANARAGAFILAWKQSGRNDTKSGTNPYYVRIYHESDKGPVVISDSKEFSDYDKLKWTDNIHVFQITPEQIAAANGKPFYIAFIPTSLNTYGTLIDKVALLSLDIEEVISDQIAGNEANKLPTAFYKGEPNNPILMATRSGVNARLMVKMNVPVSLASKILVGARKVDTGPILGSVPSVAPPGLTELSFDAYAGHHIYEIVSGYDVNSNGILETAEVLVVFSKTPKTDSSGVIVSTGLGNLDKVIIVTQAAFNSGKSSIIDYNVWGTDYAGDLISAFAHGSTSVPEATKTSPHTITSDQPGLSHPVGAKWNSSLSAETHRVSFYNGSEAVADIKESNALSQVLETAISANITAIRSASRSKWTYSGPYTFSASRDFIKTDPEWVGVNELGYAFGKVTFTGTIYVSSRTVAGGKIEVGSVVYSSQFDDVYDVTYWGGDKAREASLVQAGHATLTGAFEPNSGKVFFTRVVFSGSKSIDKEF